MAKQKFTDAEMIAAINHNDGNATQAAKDLGVCRDSVMKRKLNLPVGALVTDLAEFKIKRGDIFADLQRKTLSAITPDKLAACSAQQLATIAAILYDKERLESGKSTENIAHGMIENMSPADMADLADLQKKRTERLREEVVYDD